MLPRRLGSDYTAGNPGINNLDMLRFQVDNIRRSVISRSVMVSLIKSSRDTILGTMKVSKDLQHNGLVIGLSGFFETVSGYKYPLPNCNAAPILHRFFTGRNEVALTSTNLYKKYPFHLKVGADCNLPPSLKCSLGEVKYFLKVFAQESADPELLEQINAPKEVCYQGVWSIDPSKVASVEKEIILDGVQIIVQVPRLVFILGESVPVKITAADKDKGSIGKLVVSMLRLISYANDEMGSSDGTHAVEEVVARVEFKRFLKRASFIRRVEFATDKVNISCFDMDDEPKLRIRYAIQVKMITVNGKSGMTLIDIVLGTEDSSVTRNRSIPSEEDAEENLTMNPSGPMLGIMSLAGSMLSLLPPSYSSLPTRAASMTSLETLTPDYEDI